VTARRAVFLDRDGTINVRPAPHAYVTHAAGFQWLPGADRAMCRLAADVGPLFVVSNQRGVARGLLDRAVLDEIEEIVQRRLRPLGCGVEEFRYCTHERDEGCDCRKPAPGMLLALAAAHSIDLERSWMIGDSASDVAAGIAAGCRTCLIGAPAGEGETVAAPALAEAPERIVAYETAVRAKL
jgi:D-glycero-D-manno-heptose 1,7-bisphosphate phosphatase